jgi:hypothetical protein
VSAARKAAEAMREAAWQALSGRASVIASEGMTSRAIVLPELERLMVAINALPLPPEEPEALAAHQAEPALEPAVGAFLTEVAELGGATITAPSLAPPKIHDPERDRRITDLLLANNREVERRRTITSALHVAGEALGELLAPYSGGAPSAFEDPHIRERAEHAYERAVTLAAAFAQGAFRATHIHKKSHGIYRLLLLGERESDLQPVAIYAGENGRVWVRDLWEFMDGRFERIDGEGAL